MPEEESSIDAIPQKELYYPKINNKIPVGTIPGTIASYNASINSSSTLNSSLNTGKTTGITYSLGTTPTNAAGLDVSREPEFNPQPTQSSPSQSNSSQSTQPNTSDIATPTAEHPAMIPEDNTIVRKCKIDAIQNSSRLNKNMNTNTKESMANITNGNDNMNKEKQMKMVLLIIGLIIMIAMIYFLFW